MRYATLIRNPSTDDGTFGVLLLDNYSTWATGELPQRENKNGLSCIPPVLSGEKKTYKCTWFDSPKHGPCYLINEVEGRSMIEIHSANFMGDTSKSKVSQLLGCIALGKSIGKLSPVEGGPSQIAVLQSKLAIKEFETNLKNEDFTLTIIQL